MDSLEREGGLRILVVDDDDPTRNLLRRLLTMEGYAVSEAPDGPTAMEKTASLSPDLVLVDIMMPGQNGLDLMAALRRSRPVPVILVTAKGDESDRVAGLRLGADDYVVKPFSIAELTARIAAVLRRTGASRPPAGLEFAGLQINVTSREVTVGGRLIDLPAREYEVLVFLATSPRQVFSRQELLEQVWRSSPAWQDPATVTEHIRRLRCRIEEDPERPRWIRTVRGMGYRFDP
jgi:two-component system phosphate regulon response regulator PhoB